MADVESANESSFVDVSVDTSQENLVDDKRRQKRKRTSPEDQAILEAAYRHDPKPDKNARLELVKQVALTEKEVQIWYQNRRQSSRRKSGRPLLPHEIAQYQLSRSAPTPWPSAHHGPEGIVRYQTGDSESTPDACQESAGKENAAGAPGTNRDFDAPPRPNNADLIQRSSNALPLPAMSRPSLSRSVSASGLSAADTTASVGYFANRRSAPYLRQSMSDLWMPPPAPSVDQGRQLRKSSSLIRLSLNSEGKAEIVSKDASSPSPPRPYQTILLPENDNVGHPPSSLSTEGKTNRVSNGRSRDSRSWEFWCDKEARSELENAAEKDGSAAGAIGLLRTASGRNILGVMPSKRNSPFGNPASKRFKTGEKRSSLQRSSTSMGRLQSTSQRYVPKPLKDKQSIGKKRISGSDSDKENLSPVQTEQHLSDEDGLVANEGSLRRRTQNGNQRMNRGHTTANPEEDAEVAAFMRGGSRSSADDDLCVQGLLSLSQGNWR